MKRIGIAFLAWIPAVILLQTLWFKFSASPESVYIFSKMGMEPWGRIASGIVELIAAVLLIVPKTRWIGAGIGFGVMSGAILSHIFVLGIEVENDGGLLFLLALVTAVCCFALMVVDRKRLIGLFNR
ncbi:DoxX family protein [Flavobacterium sp. MAH-1]|uniref:DoxX family protein n=1 Tax=Flavobacterium agri TaxID=2743471 RepID=A0A7Y8Y1D5_9FLAO|nr:DoxX family protein [Flavobacterium agri]NUY80739.1 DoxX family protein [Flavobacterium agri]NYA70763.1 DoxX family protein [Flavobacterium agri]